MDRIGFGLQVLLLAEVTAKQQFTFPGNGNFITNDTQYVYKQESNLTRLQLGSFSSNPNITAIEQAEEFPTRIVNGKRISCQRAPYQAALHYNGLFVCGGSILSRYWTLTAAHCVAGSKGKFQVRVGSTQQRRGGQFHRVRLIVVKAGYSSKSMRNDLAMMRLATPLRYGICVQPIKLPSDKRKHLPNCFLVSGWGLSHASALNVQRFLRGTVVCKVTHNRCRQMYHRGGVQIYRQMLCAQRLGHDSCSGDSGGPLAHGRTLYGVVSFGIGCANANYPGVYANVRRFKRWILSVILKYSLNAKFGCLLGQISLPYAVGVLR
ncbi:trypsin beta-like [Drosophila innubila]|uniref:trypsin beta-like n=1 Tax=Drosophila innubila TaxID=198719 RepID=UPI00148C6DEC|nr:trypsin beta-like [Drosophila innubila]